MSSWKSRYSLEEDRSSFPLLQRVRKFAQGVCKCHFPGLVFSKKAGETTVAPSKTKHQLSKVFASQEKGKKIWVISTFLQEQKIEG